MISQALGQTGELTKIEKAIAKFSKICYTYSK